MLIYCICPFINDIGTIDGMLNTTFEEFTILFHYLYSILTIHDDQVENY